MEFASGGSMDRWMKRQGGKVPLAEAAPIMLQCLDGLAHAHRHGFIHRDLKPQNILLHQRQGQWTAKITDFGLAKSFAVAGLSGMTATGGAAGTYKYMPREQLTDFKYIGPASDVWSIAATFYHLLTGCLPLDFPPGKDPVAVLLGSEPALIRSREPGLPAAVAAVLDLALTVDRGERYPTAVEMKVALEKALGGSRRT
jgi:serine/threonine protein kinase